MKPELILLILGTLVLSGCASSPEATGPSITPAVAQVAPPPTPEQVRAYLAQGVKDAPDDPLPLLELALFDKQTKNPALAESGLLECWKKFPRFARAPYHLGLLYLLQGKNALALIPLRAAASLDKTDPLIQLNAGIVSNQASMEPEARSYAEAAIRIDPQYPDPYLLLARIDDRQRTTQRAIQNIEKYLKLSPAPAPGYYLMGRIYARRSDLNRAETWLRRAVEADPNNPDFWTILGRVYTEMAGEARTQEGLQCFQKALELNPNHANTHRYLGLALNRLQRYAEAIPHLQAALSGLKEPGPLYYDLGQALIKAGRAQEGAETLAKYREYRTYTDGIGKLNKALAAAPKERARHYARIRFCLKYRQYGVASIALREALQTIGPDDTLREIASQIESTQNAATNSAPPLVPGLEDR